MFEAQKWMRAKRASFTKVTKNLYFAPKKCFFSLISWTAKLKMAFRSNFSPLSYVVTYLVNGEKLPLKAYLFHFAVFKKGWKSIFLERNTTFFSKHNLIRLQTIPECIPNLLGHPVVVCWPEAVLTLVVALKRPLESEAKEEMRFLDLLRQTTRPP